MKNIMKIMFAMSALFAFSNIYTADSLAGKKIERSVAAVQTVTISKVELDALQLDYAALEGIRQGLVRTVIDLEKKVAALSSRVSEAESSASHYSKRNHALSFENAFLRRDLAETRAAGVKIVYSDDLRTTAGKLQQTR